jgi:ATP-dependent exoDNAse (exonuclease V) alpha subunit
MTIATEGQFQFLDSWKTVTRPLVIEQLLRIFNKELKEKERGVEYTKESLLDDLNKAKSVSSRNIKGITYYVNNLATGAGVIKKTLPKKWKDVLSSEFSFLDITDPDFARALDTLVNSNSDVCLVGQAGTGKTSLTKIFTKIYENSIVLATTGAAAEVLRDGGIPAQTIHSFFKLPPDPWFDEIPHNALTNLKAKKALKAASALIIDEVSMLSANTLEIILQTIDHLLLYTGNKIRTILVGDPLQLPPVVDISKTEIWKRYKTTYGGKVMFFASPSYIGGGFVGRALNKVYRQKDPEFSSILEKLRIGETDSLDLKQISNVVDTDKAMLEPGVVVLASTNATVNSINDKELKRLPGIETIYEPNTFSPVEFAKYLPLKYEKTGLNPIKLKIGSLVMCTTNHSENSIGTPEESLNSFEEGYYSAQAEWIINDDSHLKGLWFKKNTFSGDFWNGSIGTIVEMHKRHVVVELTNSSIISVGYKMKYDYEYETDSKGKLRSIPVSAYEELACIPARAITINKSQGKTLDKVHVIIPPKQFQPGMLYVAISRCKTLSGLTVNREITSEDILVNEEALNFINGFETSEDIELYELD